MITFQEYCKALSKAGLCEGATVLVHSEYHYLESHKQRLIKRYSTILL